MKKRKATIVFCLIILIPLSCKKYCKDVDYSGVEPDIFITMPVATSMSPNTSVFDLQVGVDSSDVVQFALSASWNGASFAYTNYEIKVYSGGSVLFYKSKGRWDLEYKDIIRPDPGSLFNSSIILSIDEFGGVGENNWSSQKYLGFAIIRNGKFYSGWLHLRIDDQYNLTIYQYAINTCDGKAIKAGKR